MCEARLHRGISIDDGPCILRDPSAEAGSHRDLQRRQQPEIVTAYEFRQQQIALADECDDRVVRNQLPKPHCNQRERLIQAQGVSKILAQFKERVRLLPGRRDGGEEVGLVAAWLEIEFKPGGRPLPTLHRMAKAERAFQRLFEAMNRQAFQFEVAALKNLNHSGSKDIPASSTICFMASPSGSALRYWRSEANASRQSTAVRMRAPMGISSPFRPSGYPSPFHFS